MQEAIFYPVKNDPETTDQRMAWCGSEIHTKRATPLLELGFDAEGFMRPHSPHRGNYDEDTWLYVMACSDTIFTLGMGQGVTGTGFGLDLAKQEKGANFRVRRR